MSGEGQEEETKGGSGLVVRAELLGIIVVLLLQTFSAVWWAARTEARLTAVENCHQEELRRYELLRDKQVEILQEVATIKAMMVENNRS